MTFKRRFSILIAGISVFLLSAALSYGAPAEINFMTYGGEKHPYGRAFEALTTEFNSLQDGVEVKLQSVVGDANIKEKFIVQSTGGIAPDIVWHFETPTFASRGMLADLTPYLERDGLGEGYLSDFLPGLIQRYQYQGKLYAIPFGLNVAMGVFYNPDLVRQAGLAEPQEGWNWETFRSYARKLTDIRDDGTHEQVGFSYFNWYLFPWMLSNNARAYDYTNNVWFPDKANTVEALEFAVNLEQSQLSKWVGYEGFVNQEAAMMAEGNYAVQGLLNMEPSFEIKTIHWPTNGSRKMQAGGYGLHMSNTGKTERMDASWTFIKWMTAPEQQLKYARLTGQIPVTKTATQSAVYADLIAQTPQLQSFVTETVQYGVPQPNPVGYLDVLLNAIRPRVQAALRGEVPPTEAIDQMLNDIDAYYSSVNVPLH